ncbi:MAG: TIGR00730 family Rossman fold protein [Lentimicrobiaceae bacterium]|nr:TIGR00730 family Rossman fold protein [Lentimicrobiaceae bacterium]
MKKICVFCGSSMGTNAVYKQAAATLAKLFAEQQITLVYGGANVGLMKILADTLLDAGGEVIGVMPTQLLEMEIAHPNINLMHQVSSMAERKRLMVELSDAFIALPGGFGTLDEISEILTLNQLRIIEKPLGLLNTNNYFDSLIRYFDHGVTEGFVRREHRDNIIVARDAITLLRELQAYKPIETTQWIRDIKTESNNKSS